MAQPQFPAPPAQINQVAGSMDNMTQQIYASAANDPIFGTLIKVIPPPPKVSSLFSGTFLREIQARVNAMLPRPNGTASQQPRVNQVEPVLPLSLKGKQIISVI